jgi:pimeloyl-ACP methyl ester carboxylesterase
MPFVDTGAISLFYREQGSGQPPALLIHELGGSGKSWSGVLPLLAGARRAIAPDLRHAGRSEKPPGAVELDDLADDLAALLDALRIDAADVVGSALGSLVAVVMALRHPARVRRLVLCACAPEITDTARDYLATRAERVRREGMRPVADASLTNAFPAPHEGARCAYRPYYLANDPAGYAELSLALTRLKIGPADFACIAAPTLVIQGAHDFIWPPDIGQRVAALIPGARFHLLADGAHFPHLQVPSELATVVLDFLTAASP